jgi:hypothetical protein
MSQQRYLFLSLHNYDELQSDNDDEAIIVCIPCELKSPNIKHSLNDINKCITNILNSSGLSLSFYNADNRICMNSSADSDIIYNNILYNRVSVLYHQSNILSQLGFKSSQFPNGYITVIDEDQRSYIICTDECSPVTIKPRCNKPPTTQPLPVTQPPPQQVPIFGADNDNGDNNNGSRHRRTIITIVIVIIAILAIILIIGIIIYAVKGRDHKDND